MKLPWDKDYLKISFHVVFTLILVYVLSMLLKDIVPIFSTITGMIGKLFSILAPLWIGLVIAYLLDPAADYFQKKYDHFIQKNQSSINVFKKKIGIKNNKKKTSVYKTRVAGATISYVTVVIVLMILGMFISSSLGGKSSSNTNITSIETIKTSINDFTGSLNGLIDKVKNRMSDLGIFEQSEDLINDALGNITQFTKSIGSQIIVWLSKAGGYAINLVLGIVIAFYLLKDKQILLFKLSEITAVLIPKKVNIKMKTILGDIDAVFSGYIRGQITDAAIMTVLISICLSLIGIDYAIVIGIVAGFSNVIPYVGAFVGLALAVIVGLLSGTPIKAVYAIIVLLILQQVDGAVIVPRVVGNKVDLHPILVLLALAVGGAIFGIVGMIFAVPVTAILKIFLVRYLERRKKAKILNTEKL